MSHSVIYMPIGIGIDGLQMNYLVLPLPRKTKPRIARRVPYKTSLTSSRIPVNTRSRKIKVIRNRREQKQMDI